MPSEAPGAPESPALPKELPPSLVISLRERIRAELISAGYSAGSAGETRKDLIRLQYRERRRKVLLAARPALDRQAGRLLKFFADGSEVVPQQICPRLQLVKSKSETAALFRMATLSWSIPVSQGFGRRMRFLVWDSHAGKLMGVIGLGDPVFNLNARDSHIGWNSATRKGRLVNVMDAFALGAVPPYSFLLGGKLIACLASSREVQDYFDERYSHTRGIISGLKKRARLAMITTCSALGRSSVYNRLKLDGKWYLRSVGFTQGYGHFHVTDELFTALRSCLERVGHPYSHGYRFGQGPNWRFRVVRAGLELLGMDRELARHGIKREVFVCSIAGNAIRYLRGEDDFADLRGVEPARNIGSRAVTRWAVPRAERRQEFRLWRRDQMLELLETN